MNARNSFGRTALIYAAVEGQAGALKLLLQKPHHADINALDRTAGTALHAAVITRNTEIAEELLNHPDVDVNRRDGKGKTPLALAASTCSANVVRLLMNHSRTNLNMQVR